MKEIEEDDPMELHAVSFPDGDSEFQASVFIEEFLFMGMPRENLLRMFRDPFYGGAHRLLNLLGEPRIIELINAFGR